MTNTELHELIERLPYIASILEANASKFAVPDHIAVKAEHIRQAATAIAQLIERNEVLEEALRECRELFSEIRNDWYDPRSQCREGCRIIDTALSATIRNG